ncbi:hypothetical protein P168DRAFT_12032 [Aspergillus campestris IBT 28561]|uniref:Uncharacterized protein n=1 Tax=Aspergillus campestris (strain IBT 28561) TaxID=1392248 RepID=A0A2I1DEC4_ASPC2|nr:uncharacterized protein P168DRAFT_12032 [Aspergillus campestris IBT 28561]PKY08233.1 hypothetical protein P168DRAFT_12032 [Aspergillus campestris IBT 28561]
MLTILDSHFPESHINRFSPISDGNHSCFPFCSISYLSFFIPSSLAEFGFFLPFCLFLGRFRGSHLEVNTRTRGVLL